MKKRVIIFGCQGIAVDCIDYLAKQGDVELCSVYTYDLPLDVTYGYESVQLKCKELAIECKKPRSINKKIVEDIYNLNPDFIFSFYYRKIFPKPLLKIPKSGCINIHPSLLPNYRGPVPTAWTIMNGETNTGVTIHYMDEGIDTGDILFQEKIKIHSDETGFELYKRCMKVGSKLFINNWNNIKNDDLNPIKQTGIGSYYGKLDGKHTINWQNRAEYIRNMIRIHAAPFNTAESMLFNHYFFINKASIHNDPKYILQSPGKIVDIINGHPVVSCVDGFLKLDKFDIYPKLTTQEKTVYMRVGNKFE